MFSMSQDTKGCRKVPRSEGNPITMELQDDSLMEKQDFKPEGLASEFRSPIKVLWEETGFDAIDLKAMFLQVRSKVIAVRSILLHAKNT